MNLDYDIHVPPLVSDLGHSCQLLQTNIHVDLFFDQVVDIQQFSGRIS